VERFKSISDVRYRYVGILSQKRGEVGLYPAQQTLLSSMTETGSRKLNVKSVYLLETATG